VQNATIFFFTLQFHLCYGNGIKYRQPHTLLLKVEFFYLKLLHNVKINTTLGDCRGIDLNCTINRNSY